MPNVQIDEAAGVHARSVGVHRRPLKQFEADRTCEELGCETRLSVYNPRQRCWQHEPARKYHPKVGRTRNSDRLGVGGPIPDPTIPAPIPSPDPDPVPEPLPPPTPIPTASVGS